MAKESLREYLNRKIKSKGSSLSKEKKKASKYKSISAAKKAGALYYTNKDGKVMAAVFAEDLKEKPTTKSSDRPKARPDTVELYGDPYGDMTVAEKREVDAANKLVKLQIKARKDTGPNAARKIPMTKNSPKSNRRGVDPLNLAGPKTGAAKGGMMTKKSTGYNKGGMPMVMKDGKKVPAYAADGVGKMNKGGVAKKKPAAKMMAGGMAKKKPAAKMMGGGMAKKSSGYMYGGMTKKKK